MSMGPEYDDTDRTPWVAVKISLPRHRKVIDLRRRLSLNSRQEAVGIIVELLIQTSIHCWDSGDWKGWAPEDLEDILGWRGERGDLVKGLQDAGLLDGMAVHDWKKSQRRALRDRFRHRESYSPRSTPSPAPSSGNAEAARRRTQDLLRARGKEG